MPCMSLSEKLPLPICNNLSYAYTANVREVTKFYDSGDPSFETGLDDTRNTAQSDSNKET